MLAATSLLVLVATKCATCVALTSAKKAIVTFVTTFDQTVIPHHAGNATAATYGSQKTQNRYCKPPAKKQSESGKTWKTAICQEQSVHSSKQASRHKNQTAASSVFYSAEESQLSQKYSISLWKQSLFR